MFKKKSRDWTCISITYLLSFNVHDYYTMQPLHPTYYLLLL